MRTTSVPLGDEASFMYAVDAAASLALARFEGGLTGVDIRRAVAVVHADPAWRPSFDAIWDWRRVRAHIVSPEEVPPLVAEVVEGQTGRDALVEPETLSENFFSEMLTRMLRAAGKEAALFRTVEDALGAFGHDMLPAGLDLDVAAPE